MVTVNWEPGGVEDGSFSGIPQEFAIAAAYPNPFNSALTAVIAVPEKSQVRVSLYNVLGERVAVPVEGTFNPGYHRHTLDAGRLAAGIYFLRAAFPGDRCEMRKVVLVR